MQHFWMLFPFCGRLFRRNKTEPVSGMCQARASMYRDQIIRYNWNLWRSSSCDQPICGCNKLWVSSATHDEVLATDAGWTESLPKKIKEFTDTGDAAKGVSVFQQVYGNPIYIRSWQVLRLCRRPRRCCYLWPVRWVANRSILNQIEELSTGSVCWGGKLQILVKSRINQDMQVGMLSRNTM